MQNQAGNPNIKFKGENSKGTQLNGINGRKTGLTGGKQNGRKTGRKTGRSSKVRQVESSKVLDEGFGGSYCNRPADRAWGYLVADGSLSG